MARREPRSAGSARQIGQPGAVVSVSVRRQPDEYGVFGTWQPNERYLFGTASEATVHRQPQNKYGAAPERNTPSFHAIRPSRRGHNANEPEGYLTSDRGHGAPRGR